MTKFFLGSWKNDMIHGLGIIFFPNGGYFYGNFAKNKMKGPGILKYFKGDILCGYWKMSKLHGFIYRYDYFNNKWVHSEYEMGNLVRNIDEKTVMSSYSRNFPDFLLKDQFLVDLFKEIENHQLLSKYIDQIETLSLKFLTLKNNEYYYGYMKKNEKEGLGVVFDEFRVKTVGVFKEGLLDGLGKVNEENFSLDGEWRNGEFMRGFYFQDNTNKYLFGSFFKNKCCNIEMEGFGVPIDSISKCYGILEKKNLNFSEL